MPDKQVRTGRIVEAHDAVLDDKQITQHALAIATALLDGEQEHLPPRVLERLATAILAISRGWQQLRGYLAAADAIDNLVHDTQRHLIAPAEARADADPSPRRIETLNEHQQYLDGIREAAQQLGSHAVHAATRASANTERLLSEHLPPQQTTRAAEQNTNDLWSKAR